MLRNLPNNYTRDMLLELLDEHGLSGGIHAKAEKTLAKAFSLRQAGGCFCKLAFAALPFSFRRSAATRSTNATRAGHPNQDPHTALRAPA